MPATHMNVVACPKVERWPGLRAMRHSRIMLLLGATALVVATAGVQAGRGPAAKSARAAPFDEAPAALHNMDLHLARADLHPLVRLVHATGVAASHASTLSPWGDLRG
jgi:hypothetical protein